MVHINIIFDRSDHKYSPGDQINLEIRIQVSSNTTFRSIYARLQGFAHVEWTESRQVQRDGKSHTEYTTYTSNESYFKNYQTLADQRGGSDMHLSPGSHVYHASFRLPLNLPQNHVADNGYIRYEAKVHMDVPWGFDNKESVPFSVIPRFDLNEFPHLREPVRAEANTTFGCCCWESEPLHILNILPCQGFIPGDRIPFQLEVKNDSDVSINGAHVKFVEKIVYRAHSPRSDTRESSRTLWEHTFNNRSGNLVAALQNKIFSTNLYLEPGWGFHYFNGCGIITVEYYLKSEAHVSGCHSNLSNYTSITMGTVPFASYGSQFTPLVPMLPTIRTTVPSAPLHFPSAPSDFPSAPPGEPITEQPLPSYNDAVTKVMPGIEPVGVGWVETNGVNTVETPPPIFTGLDLTKGIKKQSNC